MIRKILKIWAIFLGISWFLYGASKNSLAIAEYLKAAKEAEENGEEKAKLKFRFVILDAIDNFKEANRICDEEL